MRKATLTALLLCLMLVVSACKSAFDVGNVSGMLIAGIDTPLPLDVIKEEGSTNNETGQKRETSEEGSEDDEQSGGGSDSGGQGSTASDQSNTGSKGETYFDALIQHKNAKLTLSALYHQSADEQSETVVSSVSVPTVGQGGQGSSPNEQQWDGGLLQCVILGEEFARSGDARVLQAFLGDVTIRSSLFLAVSDATARECLQATTQGSSSGELSLVNVLRSATQQNLMPNCTLFDMVQSIASPGGNPIMPIIHSAGAGNQRITGCAIFRKWQLIDTLSYEEMQPLLLLRDDVSAASIPLQYGKPGEKEQTQINVRSKRRVEVNQEGGQYTFRIHLDIDGEIMDTQTMRLDGEEVSMSVFEEALQETLNERCRDFIHTMQAVYRLDCIKLSPHALGRFREELTPLLDMEAFWQNARITFDCDVSVRNVSTIR